jgi:ectoine hydroxylase-related dioxygenase (phytanoyl-CoA dioxygenase family)
MTPQDQIKPVELKYRSEFKPTELEEAKACVDAHGFAILKKVIPQSFVDELRAAIQATLNPLNDMKRGESRVGHAFIERCPTLIKFFDYPEWFNVVRYFEGTDDLVLRRSAAIIRNPGSSGSAWHTDWSFWSGLYKRPPRNPGSSGSAWHTDWSFWSGLYKRPPRNPNDVLNIHEGLSGRWFYLEGTRPIQGGLAVIEDSHTIDWAGPEGFEFSDDKHTFHKKGAEPKAYAGWDVPGIIPLFTDPGDMILFAARTYHYAFPNQTEIVRHSVGGPGLRARSLPVYHPWPMPESTKKFIASLPPHLKKYADGYNGFDEKWKFEADPAAAKAAAMM